MAPIKQFALASLFLASAFAQPSRRFAPFHYPVDNSTLSAASGTAPGTGISSVASTSSAASSSVSAAEFFQASSSAVTYTSAAAAEASSGSDSGSGDAAGSCAAAPETVTVTAVNTVTETFIPTTAAAASSEVLAESAGASTSAAGSSAASSAASSGFAYGSGHGYGHMSLHRTGPTASANASSAAAVSTVASSSPSVYSSSAAAVAASSSSSSSSSSSAAQGGEFYVPSSAATTVTSYAAPSSSSTSIAWVPSSSAASSSASSWSTSTSATASASQSTQSSSSGTGKRGLAYNSASLANIFSGQSQVSWAYNWGSSTSDLDSCFNYVPMLWGLSSTFTSSWSSNAQAAISAGSQYLMSFNEPDQAGQSLISPSDAAQGYMQYMQPFAGKAKLGSPAVTNGGGSMGLNWLSQFMSACSSCEIDYVPIHWYGTDVSDFESHCQQAHAQTGKPIWVTEFGVTGGADAASFLQQVLPWMDAQDWIQRYSYFMASDGILVSGDSMSSLGDTYCSS